MIYLKGNTYIFLFGSQAKENNKYRGMKGMNIEEKEGSTIGWYIRNIADIIQKCNDICIADITELYDISCYLKNIYIIYSNINVLKEIKNIQRGIHKGRHLNV